jgi:hypothetical protein
LFIAHAITNSRDFGKGINEAGAARQWSKKPAPALSASGDGRDSVPELKTHGERRVGELHCHPVRVSDA